MKRVIFSGIVAAVGGVLFGWGVLFFGENSIRFPSDIHRARSISFEGKTFSLEIADTDKARAKGLSERDFLCPDCAMLFVFDRKGRYAFWMKDMRFPLDIIWLSDDRVVFKMSRVMPESSETYAPAEMADRVLEGNAGAFDDLEVGEHIQYGK